MLGAVLAGGRSSRFGSDKAAALYLGKPLIDHAIAAVAAQCDAVVVVGREHPGISSVLDWPAPDQGPLGGFGGALGYAQQNGFDAVLTCAVDAIDLPRDLRDRLGPPPAYCVAQPVIGLWPVGALDPLKRMLSEPGSRSVRAFAERIGARAVQVPGIANLNTPDDLAGWKTPSGVDRGAPPRIP